MAETAPQISVAVVSWNTRDLLDQCLRSIEPDVRAGLAEAWVVDNASTDGSAELVRSTHPWARLIAASENLGFGRAVNLVAERTRTPWLAPANADIALTRGALDRLLRAGESDQRAGIIAPRLVLDDGTTQHSVYNFPTLPYTLLLNLGVGSVHNRIGDRLALIGSWNPDRRREVDWAIGAFLLVRRVAWTQTGGFDPQQWMYAEDLDLGWRTSRAGWRTLYEPDAVVKHRSGASVVQLWPQARREQWMRSTYAWMIRRRGPVRTRTIAVINIGGAAVRAALLTPAARLSPQRWAERRRELMQWMRLHAIGLASRHRLERHGEAASPESDPRR